MAYMYMSCAVISNDSNVEQLSRIQCSRFKSHRRQFIPMTALGLLDCVALSFSNALPLLLCGVCRMLPT